MYNKDRVADIKRLYELHKSYGEVSRILNIPKMTVSRIVQRDPNKPKGQRGPLRLITDRKNVIIKKYIRNCNKTKEKANARKVQTNCNLSDVSIRTVQRHVRRLKFKTKPVKKDIILSKFHKSERVRIASSWIAQNVDWKKVVFTDEKKFNLDGPDSWSSYIDENREIYANRRQNKGGGIMVWGIVTYHGYFHAIEMIGNFDSEFYCSYIIDTVKPVLDEIFGDENYIFQQDNAPIHKSLITMDHCAEINLNDLEWPARSPDLNIIENVWSMLQRHVYDENCQFNTEEELWQAINRAVTHVNTERLQDIQNLYKSMTTRVIKVFQNKGNKLPY